MRIMVNGEPCSVNASTLDQILEELGHNTPMIATALNSEFVHKDLRSQTTLAEGDRLEVLAPNNGG